MCEVGVEGTDVVAVVVDDDDDDVVVVVVPVLVVVLCRCVVDVDGDIVGDCNTFVNEEDCGRLASIVGK